MIEVLIALFVLAVGFLGTLPLLMAAMNGYASARHTTKAAGLAQARVEQARTVGFSALTASDSELCIDGTGAEDYGTIKMPLGVAGNCLTLDPSSARFRRETVVAQTGNLKTVTVTVRWQDMGRGHSLQHSTVIAQ